LPRHISQHVGGMVISSRPLVEIVPLERAAMEDRVVCQWDKDSCDDARFIKIDFLALGMLSLVEECVERIAVREGTPPDLSRIDFEDPAVYDRICRGDTVGLFQIESRAQIQMIRRTRPTNLEDLAVEVAIVRPGPIVGGAVNPYVRRREDQRRGRAAAFGLLAYQSAWLRHYHPAEYYCALFNNQPMGFYSLDVLGRDAERNGVEIRLPDVNASDVWCTIEKGAGSGEQGAVHSDAVRVGLGFVRDWSEETATAVV